MPTAQFSVPHHLSPDEAKTRLRRALEESRQHFAGSVSDFEESWNGNAGIRFRAMGFAISGALDVQPEVVAIEIQFPFAALPFKGRVESEIINRCRAVLA